jgi:Outer membrane efflux protein
VISADVVTADGHTIHGDHGIHHHGDVLQADARREQSRERLDNLRAQIDADIRTALLNLQSSEEQVNVARCNIDLSEETLVQSRDRFTAGVADTVASRRSGGMKESM